MDNGTLFYVIGGALAASAVVFSLVGLRLEKFPGRAAPIVFLWFALLVGSATTLAVLHSKDEEKAKAAESRGAGKETETAASGGPAESSGEGGGAAESEAKGAEEAGSPAGVADTEAGAQVFANSGCAGCHAFSAANATGTVGPNLDKVLKPGIEKSKIEEDIVDPNAEIAAGYSANIMPGTFGQTLSPEELRDLVAFLYEDSPAGEGK